MIRVMAGMAAGVSHRVTRHGGDSSVRFDTRILVSNAGRSISESVATRRLMAVLFHSAGRAKYHGPCELRFGFLFKLLAAGCKWPLKSLSLNLKA